MLSNFMNFYLKKKKKNLQTSSCRLEQATGLAFRFVIGRTKDAHKMAALGKEVEKYKDFMLIDVEEDYLKLPYKT